MTIHCLIRSADKKTGLNTRRCQLPVLVKPTQLHDMKARGGILFIPFGHSCSFYKSVFFHSPLLSPSFHTLFHIEIITPFSSSLSFFFVLIFCQYFPPYFCNSFTFSNYHFLP
jgi:hypothetical protein